MAQDVYRNPPHGIQLEGRNIYLKINKELPGKDGSKRPRLLLLRTSLKSKGVPLAKGPLINLTHIL